MDELCEHLNKFHTAPFLFIGSGISRRYINSEGWKSLLVKMAGLTGKPYEYYESKSDGSLEHIASLIAGIFHEIWWSDKKYEDSRKKHKNIANKISSPLKVEIASELDRLLDMFKSRENPNPEIEALRKVSVDGIITTNYDRLLECLFPDYRVFVGQEELLFSSYQGIAEIYKIHGCCSSPNSLVLTKEDYDDFSARNPYLASKLITIFVEHPIISLGYSLTDKNITTLLEGICGCLTVENLEKLRDRLIFVHRKEGYTIPSIETSTIYLPGRVPLPVYRIFTESLLPIYEAISKVQRKFPAKLLRRLKEHVYELVQTTEPKGRIYVQKIDEIKENFENCDVVFGVGAIEAIESIGLRGICRIDLIRDVLLEERQLPAIGVVNDSLPSLFVNRMKYCPIFKYLRKAALLDDKGDLVKGTVLPPKVLEHFNGSHQAFLLTGTPKNRARIIQKRHPSFSSYLKSVTSEEALATIPGFSFDFVDLDVLRKFLVSNIRLFDGATSSVFSRVVCLYDYRKFRIQQ